MNGEIATYNLFLQQRIAEIPKALEGLSDEELNRAPDFPGANSLFVIARHTLGSMRGWVLGIVCGQDLVRDRPAEFAASGSYGDIAELAATLGSEIEAALSELDRALLDDRYTPPKKLWGEGEPREVMRRYGLAHMLEHAGTHLGHIHITRAWLEQNAQ